MTSRGGAEKPRSRRFEEDASLWRQASTIVLGAAGGLAFLQLGVPAGGMSGGMTIFALVGASPAMARRFIAPLNPFMRYVAMLVSGVSIGASVTADTLRNIIAYPASVGGMVVCVIAMMTLCAWISMRMAGWDRQTAVLASAPGALAYILSVVMHSRADAPRVVATQMFRVLFLVAVLPLCIAESGAHITSITARPSDTLATFVIECAGGTALGYLFTLIKVPGGVMIAAMLVSGGMHAFGFANGRAPTFFLIAGQVLIGCWTGSRFVGFDWGRLLRDGPSMLANIGASVAVSAIFAWLMSSTLSLPFGVTFLAYAPGGFEAMVVLSMALGLDPFFVAAHHLARFFMLNFGMPILWMKWLGKEES